MFSNICRVLPALLLATLSAAANAFYVGATEQTLKNGFKESPSCPIRYEDWGFNDRRSTPFLREGTYFVHSDAARSHAILTWFYDGADAIYEDSGVMETLERCLAQGDCGLKKNSRLAKAMTDKLRGKTWSKRDHKRFFNYFADSPPAAAIARATKGLGRCFGDHPAQNNLEDAGFAQRSLSAQDCAFVSQRLNSLSGNEYELFKLYYKPEVHCGARAMVPTALLGDLETQQAAAPAKPQTSAAATTKPRTARERIAGLNGCQIAYGLVYAGTNNSQISRIPDDGLIWAMKYEQARIKDEPCPPMPAALSAWVQAQDLAHFEAAPDPFVFYRANLPRKNASLNQWSEYVRTVMAHYSNSQNAHYEVPHEQCSAFATWLNGESRRVGATGANDQRFLFEVARYAPPHASQAVCAQAPAVLIHRFFRDQKVAAQKQAEAQRAFEQEQRRKQAADAQFQDLLRWKPSYRPPSSEPRCYRRDDFTEVCFYD